MQVVCSVWVEETDADEVNSGESRSELLLLFITSIPITGDEVEKMSS